MMDSITLSPVGSGDSIQVGVVPWAIPSVKPGISWAEARRGANGERYGIDRGVVTDIYTADVTFHGTAAEMNALADWLQTYGRRPFQLTNINGLYFAPSVNQIGNMTVAPISRDFEIRVFASPTDEGVSNLKMSLRAVSPSFTSNPPTLAGLVMQSDGFSADKTTEVEIAFTESGVPVPVDVDMDSGLLSCVFRQGAGATASALRFLNETARAEAFSLPAFPNLTYPFGAARGTYPKRAKCISQSVSRVDLSMFDLSLTFAESFE